VRLLLDENVTAPLTTTVKLLLGTAHEISHILDIEGWRGTKDISLYDQAAGAGFEVILTNDAKQMMRRHEVEAIAPSGIHRVQYPAKHPGLEGIGLAIATVRHPEQQLVKLKGIAPGRDRYDFCDPKLDPPKFWPGTQNE
jgi:hypothetical protein